MQCRCAHASIIKHIYVRAMSIKHSDWHKQGNHVWHQTYHWGLLLHVAEAIETGKGLVESAANLVPADVPRPVAKGGVALAGGIIAFWLLQKVSSGGVLLQAVAKAGVALIRQPGRCACGSQIHDGGTAYLSTCLV